MMSESEDIPSRAQVGREGGDLRKRKRGKNEEKQSQRFYLN